MKNINDYNTDDGKVGIYCSSQEEWDKVCDLLGARPDAHVRHGYMGQNKYTTIGIGTGLSNGSNVYGWAERDHYSFTETYPASDFIEIKLNFIIY